MRDVARGDVEDAVDYYSLEAGRPIALAFVDALDRAFRSISRYPRAGSARYASELAVPGLRSKILTRYPYLIFHVERADHIDVWRVLHARRDIPEMDERSRRSLKAVEFG